jgi:DHA1 family tetracycline resistance protein-like MFS transporter
VARLGERWTLVGGLLAGAVGMAIYGLAPTGPLFWIGVPVMAFWGLSGPASQGLMTRLVSPSEQGQLQGAGASLTSVAGLLGPGVFAATFAYSVGHAPSAPWLLAALVLVAAAIVALLATRPRLPDVPLR